MWRKRFTRAYSVEPCGTFTLRLIRSLGKFELGRGWSACCEENRFRRGLSEKGGREIS